MTITDELLYWNLISLWFGVGFIGSILIFAFLFKN